MSTYQHPYPNDAMATPDDPTPGGPMTRGPVQNNVTAVKIHDKWAMYHDANARLESMPFGIAIMFAKGGHTIARKGWPKDCEGGIFMYEGRLVGAPAFILTSEGLALPMKDIMADDWYVLP